ncbi:MAG TPA: AMP-dependent synthetase/ligase, partial [Pirellulales bacterium]|nr:AMP-dependent synthetase/ligase [Pirellulales bacterium]
MSVPSTTLVKLFCDSVARGGDRTALHLPTGNGAAFRSLSWNELAHEVRRLAAGLRRAGVQPGDRVVQVSENRYEWILADLAVHVARGVHVALHASLSGSQIAWQIANSEAQMVLLSTAEQAGKLAVESLALPRGLQFFSYEPTEREIAGQPILPFTELFSAIGKDAADPLLQESLVQTTADDLATILYTSGTTGEAKGVMLSHGNLTSNAAGCCAAFETTVKDIRLSWLPFSHIFARTCDLYTWLARGSELAVVEDREKIIDHCQILRPTLLNGVPYFFERVYRRLSETGKLGPAAPGGKTYLQQALGGDIRACCSGGAALPDHVAEFFWQQGLPLVQGYGLTESSPVIATATPDHNKVGTVGRAIEGVDIKIAEDGEVLTRGPHVMLGYWQNPEETASVLQNGWLHTGDLGALDADGYLRITGRKKELIVTAGGKNIAPVFLESLLAQEPLISQAIIIGEGRKFLTALIVPNPDTLRAEIIARQIPVRSAAEALVHPAVMELYR